MFQCTVRFSVWNFFRSIRGRWTHDMFASSSAASSLLSSDTEPVGNSSTLWSSPHTHCPVEAHAGRCTYMQTHAVFQLLSDTIHQHKQCDVMTFCGFCQQIHTLTRILYRSLIPTRMANVEPGSKGMQRHSPNWWAKHNSKQHGTRAPRTPARCACMWATHEPKFLSPAQKANERICKETGGVIKMSLCITCSLVCTDVKQTSAPVSPCLRDGGDGRCCDAEAGLREHRVCQCGDSVWPPVTFTDRHAIHLVHWKWFVERKGWSESRF